MVALGYIVVGLAVVIALGWFYAVLLVLADVLAAWRETRNRVQFPRQFDLRALFSLVTVVAVACFFMQGVATAGLAEILALSAGSLALAAAIVYAYKCMLSEWACQSSQHRERDLQACVGESDQATSAKLEGDSGDAELNLWLAETNDESASAKRIRPTSTKAVRSHFRIHLTQEPKGTRAAGFGRF